MRHRLIEGRLNVLHGFVSIVVNVRYLGILKMFEGFVKLVSHFSYMYLCLCVD